MAKLNQKILGKVSGSLGDITFRQRKGKNYIASRPSKFNAPQDKISLDRRSRFALAVKIASIINSIPQLRAAWTPKVPVDSTLYNYLVKTNYKSVDPDSINENTYLTPPYGFGVSLISANITSESIAVEIGPIGTRTGIDLEIEKYIQLFSLLCLSEPSNENFDKTFLVSLISSSQNLTLDTQITVTLPLSSQESEMFIKYNTKKALFGFVTLDAEGNSVHYSNTFLR